MSAVHVPDLADVLAEVNRLRSERGMKALEVLPRGTPFEPSCCPLARALCATAVVPMTPFGYYRLGAEEFGLPDALNDFGNAFDYGAYPDLVDNPS